MLVALIFLFIPLVQTQSTGAIASELTTDGYLLAAKVLAYRIRKLETLEHVLLVTEDVSEESLRQMRLLNVTVVQSQKILAYDQDLVAEAKFQYTKIRFWNMTQYSQLFYIDLDTLPLRSIAAVLDCGDFCAVYRHSDKFNAGIFVLKPDKRVYEDLLVQAPLLPTYEGGDQGFFNSYFATMRFAPTYDYLNVTGQRKRGQLMKLPAEVNYDIGMYYLNGGRSLVDPLIIHYTMGPVKPWLWWTYPLFDLNTKWLEARLEMEEAMGESTSDIAYLLVMFPLIAIFFVVRNMLQSVTVLRTTSQSETETKIIAGLMMKIAPFTAFRMVPSEMHPTEAWLFFALLTAYIGIAITEFISVLRNNRQCTVTRLAIAFLLIFVSLTFSSLSLSLIHSFGHRAKVAIVAIVLCAITIFNCLKRLVIQYPDCHLNRYRLLKKDVEQ